jgi:hypothetical protein
VCGRGRLHRLATKMSKVIVYTKLIIFGNFEAIGTHKNTAERNIVNVGAVQVNFESENFSFSFIDAEDYAASELRYSICRFRCTERNMRSILRTMHASVFTSTKLFSSLGAHLLQI